MIETEAEAVLQMASWPNPTEWPLYVSIEDAAEIAGVGRDVMYAWANDATDPIPHLVIGKKKKLIRTAALPEYLMSRESR